MIPVYQPSLIGREKEYVSQCLDTTWISSKGEFISRFEQGFAEFIGAKYATSVSNGTVAIHLALDALGVKAGDEVIVPTLTYIASVNTIAQVGATPVFADSIEETWQVDPVDVRRKITSKTRAIMVVHLYGLPCDMDEILKICQEHDLLLIEDCAEAFGSLYKGRHVGTFGDIATFSFFGNKTITTGEGGMVVAKNESVARRAFHLKNQGVSQTREYWHDILAYNYRMTNICAAIGLAQLERAPDILAKKRQIAQWYSDGLHELPLKLHREQSDTTHSYWMCSILVESEEIRSALRRYLKAAGIETRPVFHPAHTMPVFEEKTEYPVAQYIGARGINLPSYPALTEAEVGSVCDAIKAFYLSV